MDSSSSILVSRISQRNKFSSILKCWIYYTPPPSLFLEEGINFGIFGACTAGLGPAEVPSGIRLVHTRAQLVVIGNENHGCGEEKCDKICPLIRDNLTFKPKKLPISKSYQKSYQVFIKKLSNPTHRHRQWESGLWRGKMCS